MSLTLISLSKLAKYKSLSTGAITAGINTQFFWYLVACYGRTRREHHQELWGASSCRKACETSGATTASCPVLRRSMAEINHRYGKTFLPAPLDFWYAVELVDYESKWPDVRFAPVVASGTVTSFYRKVFSREGYPEELHSENGSGFVSVKLTNGESERFNRVIKKYDQVATQKKQIAGRGNN